MQAIRQIDFTIISLSLELKVLHLAPHNIDVFSSLKKQQPRNVGFSLSYCYSMMLIRFPMHFHDVLKTSTEDTPPLIPITLILFVENRM